jgi:hypothetical protein
MALFTTASTSSRLVNSRAALFIAEARRVSSCWRARARAVRSRRSWTVKVITTPSIAQNAPARSISSVGNLLSGGTTTFAKTMLATTTNDSQRR